MGPKALRTIAGVAATLIAVSLTACGGGEETDAGRSAPAESAPAASAPAESAPAESAPASEEPAEDESDDGGSDSGSKPSKQEVTDGLVDFYAESQGLSGKKAQGFADCMVKETYDKASVDLLIMMRDGTPDPEKMSSDDMKLITDAGITCAPEME